MTKAFVLCGIRAPKDFIPKKLQKQNQKTAKLVGHSSLENLLIDTQTLFLINFVFYLRLNLRLDFYDFVFCFLIYFKFSIN